ncbi:uncharacterized protein LAJ45_10440 [Morchella importuna]|uniref:uncharacterized protein n=1 Tax=Morchella importuna TaxID=1174673 RepID=UPI001E8EDE83|nr:uncharacterized protein LAJ45_10440 [Morchella importuna]KAH8145470.1 hypothetical protein LAJ45_10440 [Morchella importuna]
MPGRFNIAYIASFSFSRFDNSAQLFPGSRAGTDKRAAAREDVHPHQKSYTSSRSPKGYELPKKLDSPRDTTKRNEPSQNT